MLGLYIFLIISLINSLKPNQKFISEMNNFIKETIKSYPFEEKIYSMEECLNEL
jgi:hypothetical protein